MPVVAREHPLQDSPPPIRPQADHTFITQSMVQKVERTMSRFGTQANLSTSEPVQYSSSGVREQTAELSSSFLSDSELSRGRANPSQHEQSPSRSSLDTHRSSGDFEGRKEQNRPDVIAEQSEPQSPEETHPRHSPPHPSRLSELLEGSPRAHPSPHASRRQSRFVPGQENAIPDVVINDGDEDEGTSTERSPLLPSKRLSTTSQKVTYENELESQPASPKKGLVGRIYEVRESFRQTAVRTYRVASNPKGWDLKKVGHTVVIKPALVLPAVFLGLLLNLLDALSYGRTITAQRYSPY